MRTLIVTGLLCLAGCFWVGNSVAQNQETTPGGQDQAEATRAEPNLGELLQRSIEVSSRKIDLEKQLLVLPDISAITKKLEQVKANIKAIESESKKVKAPSVYAKSRYGDLNVGLQISISDFNKGILSLAAILDKLETFKKEWTSEKEEWDYWKSIVAQDKDPKLGFDSLFDSAQESCRQALKTIDATLEPFLGAQELALDIQGDIAALNIHIAEMRAKLADKETTLPPPMFTLQYFKQYDRDLLNEIASGISRVRLPGWGFVRQERWVLVFLTINLFLLLLAISRFGPSIDRLYPDNYYTKRRFSAAVFMSIMVLAPFFQTSDPYLFFALVIITGISAARLAPEFAVRKYGTKIFYMIIAIIAFSYFLSFLDIPLAITRLYVFGGASLALVASVWFFISIFKNEKSKVFLGIIALSILLFCVVLVLEITGNSERANEIFSSYIETIFIFLVAWMLMQMVQVAIGLVLNSQAIRNIKFLSTRTGAAKDRMVLASRLIVLFFMTGYLLETWYLAESTTDALQKVMSLGVKIGALEITIGLVVAIVVCLYGVFLVSWAVQAVLNETTYQKYQLEHGVKVSISKIIHYVFILIGFFLVLKIIGVDMKSITIVGGALGVGIGFGLQGIARNFISGLILLLEQPIKVGDYVTIEGQWGQIKQLGLRSTVVQYFDYSEIVVPNHDLIDQSVINWTLSDRLMRIIVKVGVVYGSDVEMVMNTLEECAMASSKVTRMPEPQAVFMNFGESSLDFELRVWITNINDYITVTSFLHAEIDKRFREAGIAIAFPQRDLHIRSMVASNEV